MIEIMSYKFVFLLIPGLCQEKQAHSVEEEAALFQNYGIRLSPIQSTEPYPEVNDKLSLCLEKASNYVDEAIKDYTTEYNAAVDILIRGIRSEVSNIVGPISQGGLTLLEMPNPADSLSKVTAGVIGGSAPGITIKMLTDDGGIPKNVIKKSEQLCRAGVEEISTSSDEMKKEFKSLARILQEAVRKALEVAVKGFHNGSYQLRDIKSHGSSFIEFDARTIPLVIESPQFTTIAETVNSSLDYIYTLLKELSTTHNDFLTSLYERGRIELENSLRTALIAVPPQRID